MADTAALVVALSAQISKFERDMSEAVKVADKKTQEIETHFASMNKAIAGQLNQLQTGFASQLGGVGQVLARLGPGGLAAAAGLGAIVAGFVALSSATDRYIEKLSKLKDAAENVGLTIEQLKALQQAGKDFGQSSEQITDIVTKFAASIEGFRSGTSTLFPVLQKIAPEFVGQMNAATTLLERINVLAKAYASLADEAKRLELAEAAFGRGGRRGAQFLLNVDRAGGVENLAKNTPELTKQAKILDQINKDTEAIRERTADIWGEMFSQGIADHQKNAAETHERLSKSIKEWTTTLSDFFTKAKNFDWGSLFRPPGPTNIKQVAAEAVRVQEQMGSGKFPIIETPPLPPVRPPQQKPKEELTDEQELKNLRDLVAVLGDAVTVSEQYRLKKLEIAKLVAANPAVKASGDEARALKAADDAREASIASARERLGVANEQEIIDQKVAQATKIAEAAELSHTETIKAQTQARKEGIAAAREMLIRQADLKGLQQLRNDINDTNKVIDEMAVNSLKNLENAFVDIVTQTKTVAEAFKAMADAILKDLARILIRKTITEPLAGGIQSVIKSFAPAAAVGGIVGYSRFPTQAVAAGAFAGAKHFAGGGPVGSVPIVAHKGEIVGWPNQLKHAFGSDVQINVINNAPGTDVQTKKRDEGGVTAIDFVINTTNKAASDGRLDAGLGGRFGARPRTVRR